MSKEIIAIAHTEANRLKAERRWPDLVSHWRDVAARLPTQAMPLFYMGEAQIRCDNFSEAEAIFTCLRSDYPASPFGWIGEAMLNETFNQWGSAETRYQTLLEKFPDHQAVLQRLPKVLIKLGKVGEARQMLAGLLLKYPDRPALIRQHEKLNSVRKTDIINQLIHTFGLSDYFEYNKYLAELAIQEIVCERKQIAYIPENHFAVHQDQHFTDRVHHLYAHNPPDNLLDLDGVMKRFAPASFDLIFFDPMHTRPYVDLALQQLPLLLKPDGLLVVHDCNPPEATLTDLSRSVGGWCGQTYQAFAHFHKKNPYQSITIDTDFGVGIILNRDLQLDYPIPPGPDYEAFAANRQKFAGLISVQAFQSRIASGDLGTLLTG